MKTWLRLFACALFLAAISLPRARAASSKKAPASTAAPTSAEKTVSEDKPSMGKDKGEIESYLKGRLTAIRAGNKAQSDFNTEENQRWSEFWNKLKDERELFEVRVAKQRLNVFDSLNSLERKAFADEAEASWRRLKLGFAAAPLTP